MFLWYIYFLIHSSATYKYDANFVPVLRLATICEKGFGLKKTNPIVLFDFDCKTTSQHRIMQLKLITYCFKNMQYSVLYILNLKIIYEIFKADAPQCEQTTTRCCDSALL